MGKVKIYIWTHCPFCISALDLLKQKNILAETIILDNKPKELQELKSTTKHYTVPQIFIGSKFIGGYTELAQLNSSGELDALINNEQG